MSEIEFIDDQAKFANFRGVFTVSVTGVKSFEDAVAFVYKHHPGYNPVKCYKYGVNYYFVEENKEDYDRKD